MFDAFLAQCVTDFCAKRAILLQEFRVLCEQPGGEQTHISACSRERDERRFLNRNANPEIIESEGFACCTAPIASHDSLGVVVTSVVISASIRHGESVPRAASG